MTVSPLKGTLGPSALQFAAERGAPIPMPDVAFFPIAFALGIIAIVLGLLMWTNPGRQRMGNALAVGIVILGLLAFLLLGYDFLFSLVLALIALIMSAWPRTVSTT